MDKSLLHGLVAVLAAAVLLLQHVPLVQVGHGYDEHCVHCTKNFCTKDACYCSHKHSHERHAAAPAHAADPPTASGHAPGYASDPPQASGHHGGHAADPPQGSGHHGGHAPTSSHASAHSLDHAHAGDEAGHYTAVGTTIKPCGAPPSGILTLSLDKFVAGISPTASPREAERPSSARYVGLSDQLVVRPIFHPPALG